MRRSLFLMALLLAASCGDAATESSAIPRGTFQGEGENALVLDRPDWSLRTGPLLWSGTYRIEGDRLILRTEDVQPAAGHQSDCLGAEETYRWFWEGSELRLAFEGTPCNQNRWAVLTSFGWSGESKQIEVD